MSIVEYIENQRKQTRIVNGVTAEFEELLDIRDTLIDKGYNVDELENLMELLLIKLDENGIKLST